MQRFAAYVILSSGLQRFLIALVAGALSSLSQPPFGIFAINFLTLPVLLWLVDGASGDPERGILARRLPSFWVGWTFGLGYFVAGLWWTGTALLVEADEFAWALPLAILGLPAFLALYYGLATFLARLIWTDGFTRILAFAAAMGFAEWLRATLLTGFPWNAIGYAMMPVPVMMQSLALVGSYAMNTLAVLVFAAPALIFTGRGGRAAGAIAIILFAAHVGYGAYRLQAVDRTAAESTRTVRLVQPFIDQAAKIDNGERGRIFEEHLKLTTQKPRDGAKRPDYVVWPETSIPFILTQNPDALVRIADALEDGQILIAGAVRTENDGAGTPTRYYNSSYMIDSQGQIMGATDKVHLVPFGEYLPFESFWSRLGLNAVAAFPGGYSAAPRYQNLTAPDGTKFLSLICYEVIFPNESASVSRTADAIVNLTNDGWFGRTPGPWQHFQQARLHAVESGLPIIRSSNSGISAIIDGLGRVNDGLDFGNVGVIDGKIPPKITRPLPAMNRDYNFWLLELILALIPVLTRLSFIFTRN
ncbi:apolipoprotein N-acyltransferase [Rhizobium sp.]